MESVPFYSKRGDSFTARTAKDGIEDSKPWLTLLKAGDCILALPHCALNSPTFVRELEHHLESLNPDFLQTSVLLEEQMWHFFYYTIPWKWKWERSAFLPRPLSLRSISPVPFLPNGLRPKAHSRKQASSERPFLEFYLALIADCNSNRQIRK